MASSGSLADLTCCSICLETFTRPKVLPCQHTFCYSCLLSIGKERTSITCPQCREEYEIPEDGISAFRDNLLANSLLELWGAQKETLCSDCRSKPAVSPCEHCKANVCAPCFSEHIKLSMELNMTLKDVKEKVSTKMSDEKREQMENSKVECMKQLQDLQAFRSQKMREFFRTSQRLEKFMEMISRVHDEILESSDNFAESSESYFTFLANKADRCTTIDSLESLGKDATDLITVIRLLQDSNEPFRFVPNAGSHDADTLTLGHIEIGQAVVNIQGSYELDSEISLEELAEVFKVFKDATQQPTVEEGLKTSGSDDDDATMPAEDKIAIPKAKISAQSTPTSVTLSVEEPTKVSEPSIAASTQKQPASKAVAVDAAARAASPPIAQAYRQNQLPSKVHYHSGGHVTTLEEIPKDSLNPRGAAYRVNTGNIYVADGSKSRILMYSSDGQHAGVFCKVTKTPFDVAISTDGAYIYIASNGQLTKVNVNGEVVSIIDSCSLGPLNDCLAAVCHNEFTVLADRQHRCLIVYDENDREIRHFGKKHLKDPTAVAISMDGEMFVTDDNDRSIEVFKWNGQFLETFLDRGKSQTYGEVAVDADGFIYVTNKITHTIDVYDRQKTVVTTIGSSGRPELRSPFRITLTPDGKMLITDYINFWILR